VRSISNEEPRSIDWRRSRRRPPTSCSSARSWSRPSRVQTGRCRSISAPRNGVTRPRVWRRVACSLIEWTRRASPWSRMPWIATMVWCRKDAGSWRSTTKRPSRNSRLESANGAPPDTQPAHVWRSMGRRSEGSQRSLTPCLQSKSSTGTRKPAVTQYLTRRGPYRRLSAALTTHSAPVHVGVLGEREGTQRVCRKCLLKASVPRVSPRCLRENWPHASIPLRGGARRQRRS
jgi:hypothetical protein